MCGLLLFWRCRPPVNRFALVPSARFSRTMKNEDECGSLVGDVPEPEMTQGHDIPGRQRAEDLASSSARQLAEAQHLAHSGSWSWDLESDDHNWSDELYRIFGLPRNRPAPDLDTRLLEESNREAIEIFKG